MRIRQLDISNFRGIKDLHWLIPKDRNFICLIGPGDSGKSSILDAIYLVLGDRWNPSIADTDFYMADVTNQIVIRCVVTDLSKNLLKESSFGLWLSGIDDNGTLYQDPEDGTDLALIVQLRVDENLEPIWTIEKLDNNGSTSVSSYLRREFATFRVDDRTDVHLRWTKTSALSKISDSGNSTGNAMALASRAARESIASYSDDKLKHLTTQIQCKLNEVGCGNFSSIQIGLDTSLSSVGGNLSLYESSVPLTNYGLGSKRLAGLAVQQLASVGKSILLLDEVEHGLEPHRLVSLLQYIKSDQTYSQVFITTHSPTAVEQASTDNLAVARNNNGIVSVKFIPEDSTTLRVRRSRPSSFLGRKIVVVEGKTEEGLLLEIISKIDKFRLDLGLTIAAGIGSVVQDGMGGSEVPLRAMALLDLGYDVAMFFDNDDQTINKNVDKAICRGAIPIRWDIGNNTESQLANSLSIAGLTSLLELGAKIRKTQTVICDLKDAGAPEKVSTLEIQNWIDSKLVNEGDARRIVADAMNKAEWFKLVDNGKLLGAWVFDHRGCFINSTVETIICSLENFIYDANPSLSKECSNTHG